MAFHKSKLREFGENVPCDMNGMVPEAGDSPKLFRIDPSVDPLWWREEGFIAWVIDAIEATKEARERMANWHREGV